MTLRSFFILMLIIRLCVAQEPTKPKSVSPAVAKQLEREKVTNWDSKPVTKESRRAEYWKAIKDLEFDHFFVVNGQKFDCFTAKGGDPATMRCFYSPEDHK